MQHESRLEGRAWMIMERVQLLRASGTNCLVGDSDFFFLCLDSTEHATTGQTLWKYYSLELNSGKLCNLNHKCNFFSVALYLLQHHRHNGLVYLIRNSENRQRKKKAALMYNALLVTSGVRLVL